MPLDEQVLRIVRSEGGEPEPERRLEWPRRTWGWIVGLWALGFVVGAMFGLGV